MLAYRFVPDIRTGARPRLDLIGALLATTGLSAVVYGVIEGQRYDWGTVRYGITIGEIIGAGLVILAAFVAWERRHREPLMPLGLFRSRTFAIMVLLNVAVQFALQSMLLVNSINLQSVLGMTAVRAGLTSLPLTLALTTLAPFAGRLTDRFGGKYVLMAGLVVFAAGIAGIAAVSSTHATSLTFAPVLAVAGLGMGAIFAPLATEAMRAAPPGWPAPPPGFSTPAASSAGPWAAPSPARSWPASSRRHAAARRRPTPASCPRPPDRSSWRARPGDPVRAAGGPRPVRGQPAARRPAAADPRAAPADPRRLHARLYRRHPPTLAISVAVLLAGAGRLPAAAPPHRHRDQLSRRSDQPSRRGDKVCRRGDQRAH